MTVRVSAILPVRNGSNYLAEALASMLEQTVPLAEIIVVDDGSTDDTIAIAGRAGECVRVVHQDHAGQGAALANGVALASGEFLAFNDHDDLWSPRKLEVQLAALAADPQLDAVFGHAEQFVSPELAPEIAERLKPPVAIMPGELAVCMLVRTTSLHRVGNFDPAEGNSAFLGWLARTRRSEFHTLMLNDIVARRRLHLTNYGRVQSSERDKSHLSALRRHLMDRRG